MINKLIFVLLFFVLLGCSREGTLQLHESMISRNESMELSKRVLSRFADIDVLWRTNNIRAAYKEIEELRKSDISDFFRSEEMCRSFLTFVTSLRFDSLSLEDRSYYLTRCIHSLNHMMYESIKKYPQNIEFYLMLQAEAVAKFRSEYSMICSQMDQEAKSPNPPEPLVQGSDSGLGYRVMRKDEAKAFVQRESKGKLMTRYRKMLELKLKRYPNGGFDSDHDRQQIMQIPEPRRSELIKYIESKIGRKMKWRE